MYLTGTADGKAAIDNGLGAVSELKEHKLLGIYLVYATAVLFVFKLLHAFIKKGAMTTFFILLLLVFIGANFKQGKDGGELVYEYGANVEIANKHADALETCQDTLDELNEAAEELKCKEVQEKTEAAMQSGVFAQEAKSDESKTLEQESAPTATPANEQPETAQPSEAVDKAVKAVNEAVETVNEHIQQAGDVTYTDEAPHAATTAH